ncbi:MAG: hypothetical protein ACO3RV_04025, partial [Luteolibacter sp.]
MKSSFLIAPLLATAAHAALTTDLVIYYDFEQNSATGLANKAPGATDFNATWAGGTRILSQTGFTGDASFTANDGASNRGTMLVGNALNIVDLENAYLTTSIGSADLGNTFSISIWTYLAPGASNGSDRFHALESKNNYDVSWGTTST